MLFPYQFIENHSIYALQQWMDDLFLNVWCTADAAVDYNIDLLPDDLKEITLAIFYDARITTDYLYGPIERVYIIFQGFDQPTKDLLAQAYKNNNNVLDLCKQQNGCNPYVYSTLQALSEPLKNELISFYKSLFTSVIHLKAVQDKIGTIDSHYDEFVTTNDERKCPFCGLNSIKGPNRTVRDAYDHYLPKDIYPFNSINFKNLAPMCHECNSSHKLRQDPITSPNTNARRRAFFPYDTDNGYEINIDLTFSNPDINTLSENDVTVNLTSPTHQQEVDTWKEVFGIEERYKEKCASKTDGKYWFMQIHDEYNNLPFISKVFYSKGKHIQNVIKSARTNPFAAGNFIKASFLESCAKMGII
ncbi:hypothetical protein DFQ04_0708 [Algoriphagus boseongensis]|uniref:HNH endonuclease n=1 Tax=Algoriphagus boseongensis TaxID=1442587 RepID=A0A4V3D2H0_9BACT|nr:hypothetical protein [Algoriphagus boseongensis]TDQ18897.1 hypothetical protein DFQ04_0708 [Algoriphagus boseongensis]